MSRKGSGIFIVIDFSQIFCVVEEIGKGLF